MIFHVKNDTNDNYNKINLLIKYKQGSYITHSVLYKNDNAIDILINLQQYNI